MFYVHRIARLSPVYYVTILFFTFVFTRSMVDMPAFMTPAVVDDTCQNSYWVNLLYIQNIVGPKDIVSFRPFSDVHHKNVSVLLHILVPCHRPPDLHHESLDSSKLWTRWRSGRTPDFNCGLLGVNGVQCVSNDFLAFPAVRLQLWTQGSVV